MTRYQELIAAVYPDSNPRHVEAWMRLEYGTLDHLMLSAQFLSPFVEMAREHPRDSENLARSYGL